MGAGETITWRGRHLGWRRELTVAITAFDRPRHLRDAQVRGAFRHFEHDHWFDHDGAGGTCLRERFAFTAPWGPLGRFVSVVVLIPHLRSFLTTRAGVIRELAEGEGWKRFLTETNGADRP
jgi:ligand-binding SRPBCC domain-containing protein